MRQSARIGGAVTTMGPLVLGLTASTTERPWLLASAAGAAAAVSAGGLLYERYRTAGSLLATAGILATAGLMAEPLSEHPARALLFLLAVVLLLALLWTGRRYLGDGREERSSPALLRARTSAWVSLVAWFLFVAEAVSTPLAALGAVAASCLFSVVLTLRWLVQKSSSRPAGAVWVLSFFTAVTGAAVNWGEWRMAITWAALAPLATLLVSLGGRKHRLATAASGWLDPILEHPARLPVATFALLVVLGTLLLALPACSSSGTGIGIVDAAFTAVSAVCVTGLIVLDTPVDFSPVGQVVILALIQAGGLGIMSLATAVFSVLGRRLRMRQEGAVAEMLSGEDRGELFTALRRMLQVTVVAELAGGTVLAAIFVRLGDGFLQAIWRGMFTAVSAFCNAGFALQSDSLVQYQQYWPVLHVVALLIIAGGLSPAVVVAIPGILSGRFTRMQTKLALSAALILLFSGAMLYATLEWSNSLAGLPIIEKLHNAWFQSVTLRTAGFNSVDIETTLPATKTVMMTFMFIGGGTGGTAGGVKTTTVAILLLAAVGALRGRSNVRAFGRKVSHKAVYRATAIVSAGFAAVLVTLMAVQVTQQIPAGTALFEIVSALGTVGLSTGGTAMLDDVGKIIIMVGMFIGRIGPLTLFLFLVKRRQDPAWTLPDEEIDVG